VPKAPAVPKAPTLGGVMLPPLPGLPG
jgi:hypothetical protein